MSKLLVILGPTAAGKTDLALNLAKKFNGELISCDSRQVYVGLDVGTGKYPSGISNFKFPISKNKKYWEINGVKIWMYDVISPKKQYTVADYVKDADKVLSDIRKRGKLPIIVGGTGLYLQALVYGLSNLAIPVDLKLRKELTKLTTNQLQERLKEISYAKWKSMNYSDRQNPRRLLRAIELETGRRDKGNWSNQGLAKKVGILKIGLTASRDLLYKRTDQQVVKRISQGMVEEAKKLYKNGLSLKRMRQLGLEYGVLADYLENVIKDKEKLIKIMQNKIHDYIRRQLTWFKKEKEIRWFDITDENFSAKVEKLVGQWYYS